MRIHTDTAARLWRDTSLGRASQQGQKRTLSCTGGTRLSHLSDA